MNEAQTDEEKALEKLERLRRKGSPCEQWRGVGYFDVPGAVMRGLAESGKCEMRKLSGSSPTEFRPT